jgi:hypothetical protein
MPHGTASKIPHQRIVGSQGIISFGAFFGAKLKMFGVDRFFGLFVKQKSRPTCRPTCQAVIYSR